MITWLMSWLVSSLRKANDIVYRVWIVWGADQTNRNNNNNYNFIWAARAFQRFCFFFQLENFCCLFLFVIYYSRFAFREGEQRAKNKTNKNKKKNRTFFLAADDLLPPYEVKCDPQ